MSTNHPKYVRRRILLLLYEHYMRDPLEMLAPDLFIDEAAISRQDLVPNMHYLADRGLVELMLGYNPPLFASARIRPGGIDLVENRYEFNLLFPPEPGAEEELLADIPRLLEELMVQAELSPLDGEARKALLRDVDFLRQEVSRPAYRWRRPVIDTVLGWIDAPFPDASEVLPALPDLRRALDQATD
jgi:hypothetical protein